MEKILCGPCALKTLDLESRKDLALSLNRFTVYRCAACSNYMYFDGKKWWKTPYYDFIQSLADFDLQENKRIDVLENVKSKVWGRRYETI